MTELMSTDTIIVAASFIVAAVIIAIGLRADQRKAKRENEMLRRRVEQLRDRYEAEIRGEWNA
jgi:hypothetical protein